MKNTLAVIVAVTGLTLCSPVNAQVVPQGCPRPGRLSGTPQQQQDQINTFCENSKRWKEQLEANRPPSPGSCAYKHPDGHTYCDRTIDQSYPSKFVNFGPNYEWHLLKDYALGCTKVATMAEDYGVNLTDRCYPLRKGQPFMITKGTFNQDRVEGDFFSVPGVGVHVRLTVNTRDADPQPLFCEISDQQTTAHNHGVLAIQCKAESDAPPAPAEPQSAERHTSLPLDGFTGQTTVICPTIDAMKIVMHAGLPLHEDVVASQSCFLPGPEKPIKSVELKDQAYVGVTLPDSENPQREFWTFLLMIGH